MNPIIIQDYDPGWPELFETLRLRIASALDGIVDAIEHVGSTVVPGLAAKPIIDMDALLASGSDLPLAVARLASIGYAHEGDLGIPGREAFRSRPADYPHHLYVCHPNSPAYSGHIAFRDYLRKHEKEAAAYAELKRQFGPQVQA